MQNSVATAVLALFPVFAACLFVIFPLRAAILSIVLAAQLLLPAEAFIKFDQIPQFDKTSIPAMCLIVGCVVAGGFKFQSVKKFGFVGAFAMMFLFGPVITSELNSESLTFGPRFIPGVGLYDAFSALVISVFTVTPYFVGREFLRDEAAHQQIMRFLALGALIYSIPLLFEVRFSPQLHYWIYGFFPGSFEQSVRNGGFRPMVFMGHGLAAAHFVLIAFLASVALWRTRTPIVKLSPRKQNPFWLAASYLAVILYFCRTLGAGLYGLALAPLILLSAPKIQIRIAAVLVFLALLYPTLRYADMVPTRSLVELANSLSADRAESLNFRFDNEQILLEHAAEKPLFGWGRFGRNRVYDPDTGRDLTITDGEWIKTLGQFGALGFIAEFGLLSIAVFRAASAFRFTQSANERIYLASLSLMVSISIFDLLPNAFLMPWTWLIAGALLGRAELLLERKSLNTQGSFVGLAPPMFGAAYRVKGTQ